MSIDFTGVTTLYMHVQYTFTNCDIFEYLNVIGFYYGQVLKMNYAIWYNSSNLWKELISGNQKFNKGWTSLHLAAYFGHTEVVKILLEVGVFQEASDQ